MGLRTKNHQRLHSVVWSRKYRARVPAAFRAAVVLVTCVGHLDVVFCQLGVRLRRVARAPLVDEGLLHRLVSAVDEPDNEASCALRRRTQPIGGSAHHREKGFIASPETAGDPRCGKLLESRIVDGTLWAIIHLCIHPT